MIFCLGREFSSSKIGGLLLYFNILVVFHLYRVLDEQKHSGRTEGKSKQNNWLRMKPSQELPDHSTTVDGRNPAPPGMYKTL